MPKSNVITRLQDLEDKLVSEKALLERTTGQRDAVIARMKELGVSNAKEGQAKLKSQEKRIEEMEERLDKALDELEELLNGVPS